MYCQACGTEIQPGLNYCSRCGSSASVPATKEVLVPVDLTSPVRWVSVTVGLTFLAGLVIIFTAIAGLSMRGLNSDNVMAIAFAGMVTLGCIELSLIRLLSRLLGVSKERGTLANVFHRSKQLKTPQPQQYIQPAPTYTDPLPSVTEHTTRTFAAAYREPRAKK
ncbi:MAG: hypothetical protein ACJ741_17635 [Pyrinomonadaceae bacterium]